MNRDKIYLTGIILLVIGLSFSRAFVSISYVIIIATWLFDKKVLDKFAAFFKNKAALALASIYFLHLLGLLYTSDFSYAWLDIRTKIPLLILPLVFSTISKFSKREFIAVLLIFALSVTASFGTAVFYLIKDSPVDFREAFHFVSHIRLSLMAVIALSIFLWLSFDKRPNMPTWTKFIFIIFSLFLIYAIGILGVMSGMLLMALTSLSLVIIYLLKGGKGKSLLWSSFFVLFFIATGFYVFEVVKNYNTAVKSGKTASLTARGNKYEDLSKEFPVENGSYIGDAVCFKEMKEAWNKRSEIPFDSLDIQQNAIKYTLLRYLNSKHLSKDYEGVMKLDSLDVANIEKGFANYEYTKTFSVKKRIYKVLWEYDIFKKGYGNINESSGIKRLFLWKTGLELIAQNPLFGVGTGDVKKSFNKRLQADNSPLAKTGLRAHNQFISIAVAFGIAGLLFFVFVLFYPMIKSRAYDFLFLTFFIAYFFSMLWEDSLETQIGVTIFAFFYPFYLFLNPFEKRK